MSAPDISRESWLDLRRSSIGASEAAAACGEDPSVSPIELVCRKNGTLPEIDLAGVEAVDWGNILEPVIVAESARRAGVILLGRRAIEAAFASDAQTELVGFVEGKQPFLRSRARPWQTATLDGLACGPVGDLVGVEAKNAGQYMASAWDVETSTVPDKFRLQCAHQLAVAPALSSTILAGLVGGNSLRSVRLERVRIVQVIEAVVAIEETVWDCVRNGTLPELSGPPASVARALKALHPDDNGETVMLSDAVADLVRAWQIACAAQSQAKKDAELALNAIKAALGDATFGEMPDGSGTFSLKTTERDGYEVPACKYRTPRFTKAKKAGKPAKNRS